MTRETKKASDARDSELGGVGEVPHSEGVKLSMQGRGPETFGYSEPTLGGEVRTSVAEKGELSSTVEARVVRRDSAVD